MMKKTLAKKIKSAPKNAGVYLFKNSAGLILYIGKALNLKNRVLSHFSKNTNTIKEQFLNQISDIDWITTDTEKQALILENHLIKKYKPRYNIQWRDDKSYFWVIFSQDEWPRLLITHQKQLSTLGYKPETEPLGPFTNGKELKKVLRALRRIIPYRTCKNSYEKPCLQWHLGLCPAHKNQKQIAYRKALNSYKNSLNTLMQFLKLYAGEPIRIEAYDISNIQGAWATGSMIVFNGEKNKKSDYRKFKIKTVRGANDTAMIKEILRRRFRHPEWPRPDLILIDGGKTQLNAAKLEIGNWNLEIPLFALAKREDEIYTEYSSKILRLNALPTLLRLNFQAIRNEAHRFAIFYYRHLHGSQLRSRTASKKIRKKIK